MDLLLPAPIVYDDKPPKSSKDASDLYYAISNKKLDTPAIPIIPEKLAFTEDDLEKSGWENEDSKKIIPYGIRQFQKDTVRLRRKKS